MRTQIIQQVVSKLKAKNYLEIGVYDPERNFDHIWPTERKHACDVRPIPLPVMRPGVETTLSQETSDECFDAFKRINFRFDVIFIDGDHTHEQSKKDLQGALKILASGGVIVMHDVLPERNEEATPQKPNNGRAWCGEVWKTWLYARCRGDLKAYCLRDDHGVGLIRRGNGQNTRDAEADRILAGGVGAYRISGGSIGLQDDWQTLWQTFWS